MKIADNYAARYELWACAGKVCRLPAAHGLPPFNSYEEFNAWKRQRMEQVARQGGIR